MRYRCWTWPVFLCVLLASQAQAQTADSPSIEAEAVTPADQSDEFGTFWHVVVPLVEEVLAVDSFYDRRDRLIVALGDSALPGEVVARMGAAVRVVDSLATAGRHERETVRGFLLAALHPAADVRDEAVEAAEAGGPPPRLAVVRSALPDRGQLAKPHRPRVGERQPEVGSSLPAAERADRIREYKNRRLVLRGSSVVRTTGYSSGYATGMPGGGTLASGASTYTTRVVGSDWRVEDGLGRKLDAYQLALYTGNTKLLDDLRSGFQRRKRTTGSITVVGAVLLGVGIVFQVAAISAGFDDPGFPSLQPTAVAFEVSGSALMVGCAISWTGYPSKHRRVREHYDVEAASTATEEYNAALRDELGLASDDVLFLDLQGRGPARPAVRVAFSLTGFQVAF